jgi:pyruvate/2-oxoglutarate dehydrogenase complex dihydrolipoamide acyltransferase (E2) component
MTAKIKLDALAKNAKQGRIGKMFVKAGDSVKAGDKLFQVESVKGNSVVKAKTAGTVKTLLVAEGATVKIGQELAEIEQG